MRAFQKWRSSGVGIVTLFAVALILFTTSAITGAQAALSIRSDVYSAEIELKDIGVTLTENEKPVSKRDFIPDSAYVWDEYIGRLLVDMPEQSGGVFKIGFPYQERFAVNNSGRIDEYVRVRVYRYWATLDENGELSEKHCDLDPSLIHLSWDNLGSDWILDTDSETAERSILYYNRILPVGESTVPFTELLTIDGALPYKVTQTTENGVITTVYDYNGVTFQLEVEVDAVQTHNGRDAIQSAWGLTDEQLETLFAQGFRIG